MREPAGMTSQLRSKKHFLTSRCAVSDTKRAHLLGTYQAGPELERASISVCNDV